MLCNKYINGIRTNAVQESIYYINFKNLLRKSLIKVTDFYQANLFQSKLCIYYKQKFKISECAYSTTRYIVRNENFSRSIIDNLRNKERTPNNCVIGHVRFNLIYQRYITQLCSATFFERNAATLSRKSHLPVVRNDGNRLDPLRRGLETFERA